MNGVAPWVFTAMGAAWLGLATWTLSSVHEMAVHLASISAHVENMVERQSQTDDRLKNITSRIRDLESTSPRR